ncbi:hypothetical protein K438DRAFT_1786475 [Mycena galopus ATCC 62051]|nr:hypothetical protein K438DRAFT_1786475 [Mycena galopus ATCC 62051]
MVYCNLSRSMCFPYAQPSTSSHTSSHTKSPQLTPGSGPSNLQCLTSQLSEIGAGEYVHRLLDDHRQRDRGASASLTNWFFQHHPHPTATSTAFLFAGKTDADTGLVPWTTLPTFWTTSLSACITLAGPFGLPA